VVELTEAIEIVSLTDRQQGLLCSWPKDHISHQVSRIRHAWMSHMPLLPPSDESRSATVELLPSVCSTYLRKVNFTSECNW
jgi:hypothetical protein